MIVTLNIQDELLKNINSFTDKHGFSTTSATIIELIRLGLLTDKFVEETNLLPNIIQPVQSKIDVKPFLPTSILDSPRFLAKIPNILLTQVNSFKINNQLKSRSQALSILIRYALENLEKYKPGTKFELPSSLQNDSKTIVLSKDKELFYLLQEFQDEISCSKRTLAVSYLLQFAFQALEKS